MFGPRQKTESVDPYAWVPTGHLPVKPELKVADPILHNPCSYDSVKKVLQHIHDQRGVASKRKWTCVGCDGLPYALGSRLIQETDSLKDILLIPGLGHLEMNAVKGCFKLLWEVCLQDIAKMLGFRTPRALVCCQSCTDNHKSWMILTIFLKATLDELLTTYIKQDQTPSVARFYGYIAQSNDKNYRFMCDVVLNYVLAVFALRCGVRRNNAKFILASKCQFMKLFYGLNQTYYQEILYRDLKCHVLAPDDVNHFLDQTQAYSVSGHCSKGEGGDFVLEAVNRRAKRWLPPGIPEHKHWIEVCRNLDLLEEIRQSTLDGPAATDADMPLYQRDLSNEILQWRVKLRQTAYLSNTGNVDSAHVSVSGCALDRDLLQFETTCRRNLTDYLNAITNGVSPGKHVALTPVFVTPLQRSNFHDMEKKTKGQIIHIIENAINEVRIEGDIEEAFALDNEWKKIKVKTKKDMLMFYKEVMVALENASAVESDNNDDNDDDEDA